MADVFDAAKEETDRARRGLLSAIAQGGTAARQAYEAQQAALQSQRERALQDMAKDSGLIGAPEQQLVELRKRITDPYDRQIGQLGQASASRDASFATRQAAGESYLNEVDAALPVLRAQGDRQLAQLRAEAEDKQRQRDLQTMLAEMQLQRAGLDYDTASTKAAADRAKAASGGDLSDSELRTRLNGAGEARQASIPKPLRNLSVLGVRIPMPSQTALSRQAGIEAGYDPARVLGLTQPKPAAPAKTRTPSQQVADMEAQAKLQRMTIYNTARRAASPETFKEFERALNPDVNGGVDPLDYVAELSDADLRKRGISRKSLTDWVRRYSAV